MRLENSKNGIKVTVVLLASCVLAGVVAVGLVYDSDRVTVTDGEAPALQTSRMSEQVSVAVLGDEFSGGVQDIGGVGGRNWTRQSARLLYEIGRPIDLLERSESGAGFVARGQSGNTLLDMASAPEVRRSSVVVLFGGRSDTNSPIGEVGSACKSAVDALSTEAPTVVPLLVGPYLSGDAPPDDSTLRIRDELRECAEQSSVMFVDPISRSWFAGDYARFISVDSIHPDNAGHRYLGELMVEPLEKVMDIVDS